MSLNRAIKTAIIYHGARAELLLKCSALSQAPTVDVRIDNSSLKVTVFDSHVAHQSFFNGVFYNTYHPHIVNDLFIFRNWQNSGWSPPGLLVLQAKPKQSHTHKAKL